MQPSKSEYVQVQKECNLAIHFFNPAVPNQETAPVLFVHGLTLSSDLWQYTVPQIVQAGFGCITLDLRGHGESVPAGHARSISEEMVFQDILAVLKHISRSGISRANPTDQVHFVGLSLGGFIGMRLAARYPWVLRSLVCVNTTCADEPGNHIQKLANAFALSHKVPGLKHLLLSRIMKKLVGSSCHWQACNNVYNLVAANTAEVAKLARGVNDRASMWIEAELVQETNVPIMYVHGDDDRSLPLAHASRSADALGVASNRFVVPEKVGHTVPIEAPEMFNQHLLQFLQALQELGSV